MGVLVSKISCPRNTLLPRTDICCRWRWQRGLIRRWRWRDGSSGRRWCWEWEQRMWDCDTRYSSFPFTMNATHQTSEKGSIETRDWLIHQVWEGMPVQNRFGWASGLWVPPGSKNPPHSVIRRGALMLFVSSWAGDWRSSGGNELVCKAQACSVEDEGFFVMVCDRKKKEKTKRLQSTIFSRIWTGYWGVTLKHSWDSIVMASSCGRLHYRLV